MQVDMVRVNDGGTQFVNETVEALKLLLDTTDIKTLPYSKEENSIVERVNKEIIRHLRAFVFDEKIIENWSDSIPMVMRIINSAPHSSLGGVSAAELMFGNMVTLYRHLYHNLPSSIEKHGLSANMRAWIDEMLSTQARLINIARSFQKEKDAKHVAHEPDQLFVCPGPLS